MFLINLFCILINNDNKKKKKKKNGRILKCITFQYISIE